MNNPSISVPYFVGIGFLLSAIIADLVAVRTKYWDAVPNVDQLLSFYTTRSYKETLTRNAIEMVYAVKQREIQNDEKALWIQISWYLLIIGLTIFFILLGLMLFGLKGQLNIPST